MAYKTLHVRMCLPKCCSYQSSCLKAINFQQYHKDSLTSCENPYAIWDQWPVQITEGSGSPVPRTLLSLNTIYWALWNYWKDQKRIREKGKTLQLSISNQHISSRMINLRLLNDMAGRANKGTLKIRPGPEFREGKIRWTEKDEKCQISIIENVLAKDWMWCHQHHSEPLIEVNPNADRVTILPTN